MKKVKLEKQYNPLAEEYHELHIGKNKKSTRSFFRTVLKHIPSQRGLKLIDFGCGPGTDFEFYLKKGFRCFGLEASSEMVTLAQERFPGVVIDHGSFSGYGHIHYNKSFDVIVSKWALQTTPKMDSVYEKAVRILKTRGYFIFLVVHPFRQFIEKKKQGKNYFKKEVVNSEIFDKQIVVHEPSHTMEEWLSPYFLEHFELVEMKEDYEFPAAEQIGGDIYPTHMIVVAKKK